MAERLVLVTKATGGTLGQTIIDGVTALLLNADDGQSNAVTIQEAVDQCRVGGIPLPNGYFDTVAAIADLTSGALKDDKDCMIFLPLGTTTVQG